MRRGTRIACALALGALVSSARGDTGDRIQLEMVVRKEITTTDAKGTKKVELVEPKLVVPGEEVIYRIVYTNVGAEPTSSVVVTNRIPEHMTYVGASAEGKNAAVLFSVDGTEFAARDRLRVRTPEGELRPAADQDLTHIRWIVNGDVQPGKTGSVAYRARLQ